MGERRIGIYPGTFDPVTNGHIDIIRRAQKLVDHLIVAVAVNVGKGPMFDFDARIAIVNEEVADLSTAQCTIEVRPFEGLLTGFAEQAGAAMIIRGLRAVTDFDYEFQMTGMNARLNSEIQTVFLMASERHQFIASRLVKEIARLGGDISSFVSPGVREHLLAAIAAEKAAGD
ncbi:MAG: pantetheine-phosphate adenylyltransferase [Alphaproteobacteria bacterium]